MAPDVGNKKDIDQKYIRLSKIFKLVGYLLLAISIAFAVMAKFVWAAIFGIGMLVCSFIESHFEKKQPGYIPDEYLEGPDK